MSVSHKTSRSPNDVLQSCRRAAQLDCHKSCFPVEVGSIDELLEGGLPPASLIEISGSPGVGKTQMCLQLTANMLLHFFNQLQFAAAQSHSSQAPTFQSRILYISTAGTFPVERLRDILIHRLSQFTSMVERVAQQLLELLFIEQLHYEELSDIVDRRLAQLLQCFDVRLVIIDSIADPLRNLPPFGDVDAFKRELSRRASKLFHIASMLKFYSSLNMSYVVITNQVADSNSITSEDQQYKQDEFFKTNIGSCRSSEMPLSQAPCLGLAWSSCVNVRLMITKCKSRSKLSHDNYNNNQERRELQTIFNPHGPSGKASFIITANGIADDDI